MKLRTHLLATAFAITAIGGASLLHPSAAAAATPAATRGVCPEPDLDWLFDYCPNGFAVYLECHDGIIYGELQACW